jgi:hypothetical protein
MVSTPSVLKDPHSRFIRWDTGAPRTATWQGRTRLLDLRP